MSGKITEAENGSAHFTCQTVLIAIPAKAISEGIRTAPTLRRPL
jgi:hypothetical protein